VPGLPITVTGGLKNPQGARALYLGNTIYRIHGTNNDRTVGRANSSGCFRLTNENVVHLASIAKVGTKVKVLQAYNGTVSESAPVGSLFSGWSWGSQEPKPAEAKPAPKKPAVKQAGTSTKPTAAPTVPAKTGSIAAAAAPVQQSPAAADLVAEARIAAAEAASAAAAARAAADAARQAAAAKSAPAQ
ncbi:MAG: L,D-transpeptidase family protein, partial [Hyphomicrobiaceae bacterium]|nr:L,D-transpeptidase family protein [Hyphomicrobiaceae bacterium]